MMKQYKWLRTVLFTVGGVLFGLGYYHLAGCSGNCADNCKELFTENVEFLIRTDQQSDHFHFAVNPAGSTLELVAVGLEAGAAVDRTIALGLEGHLSGGAAAVADHFEVLALAAAVGVLGATGSTALVATGGIVLEALVSKELLLRGGEYEFLAAVTAYESLVFKHGWVPPKIDWYVSLKLKLFGLGFMLPTRTAER